MRFLYLVILLLTVIGLAFGQLSGTKTVGGTSPDYATIRDAFNAVSTQGVGAPGVTFTIRSGVYTEDSLVIRTATASPNTPITVKPASGATVVINATPVAYSNRAAILIDSTRYVTIDGSNAGTSTRNMTVNALGVIGARGIRVINSSTNATIKNCIVTTGWTPATDSTIYRAIEVTVASGGKNCHNALIENNLVKRAGAGIMTNGVSAADSLTGLVIRYNVVDSVSVRGIYTYQGQMGSKIYNNEVTLNVGQATNAGNNMYGIFLGAGSDLCRVYNNKVRIADMAYTGTTASYGIVSSIGSNHGGNVIYNNFIAMNVTLSNATGSLYPLYVSESTIPDSLLFNTAVLTGASTSARRTNTFYKGSATGACVIKNNILINLRVDNGAQACAIGRPSTATVPVINSDYNNLYVGTDLVNRKIGSFTAASYFATLADWQTGNGTDGASVSVDVPFVSATDLHVPKGTNSAIKNGATPIPGYTTDIDGETRSLSAPDIGADEFSGTTDVIDAPALPQGMALDQNYPNPFNPSTLIRFQIPASGMVTMTIVDVLGRQVATLVQEHLPAGVHAASWNAAGQASGVYFCRLESGGRILSQKMVLTK